MSCFKVRIILHYFSVEGLQHIFSHILLDIIRKIQSFPKETEILILYVRILLERGQTHLWKEENLLLFQLEALIMWARPNPNPFQCPTEALKVDQIAS